MVCHFVEFEYDPHITFFAIRGGFIVQPKPSCADFQIILVENEAISHSSRARLCGLHGTIEWMMTMLLPKFITEGIDFFK